jgi:hypothetical protein
MASNSAAKSNQGARQQLGFNAEEGVFLGAGGLTSVEKMPVAISGVYSSAGKDQAAIATGFFLPQIKIHAAGANEPRQNSEGAIGTVMAMVRDFSRIGKIPVPEGDPLRFHDFTADSPIVGLFSAPARTLSSSIGFDAAYDQRMSSAPIEYLYVTKWPEVMFHARAPIGAVRPDFPLGVDAAAVRSILRKPEFEISATETAGYYEENPTNVKSGRQQTNLLLDTRPFLIANNLLCYSGLSYSNAYYGISRSSLSYPLATIALQRVFTDLTGIGAQLSIAEPHGFTPFDFDSLAAAHELDLRGQYGNNQVIVGVVFQYDLDAKDLYTSKYSFGPNLHGVMPRVTYDSRSRSIGMAADVVGLTY